jgi:DNA-binding GntR family transcriptional regulator
MLVELVPRRGAFVKKYELPELVDIYEIRVRLEPLGAAEAARSASDEKIAELIELCSRFSDLVDREDPSVKEIDYEFHMKIMELSGNQLLYNIISSYSIIPIANFYGFFKEPTTSAKEHEVLCDAIRRRDVRAARAAMFAHVDSSRKHLLAHIGETVQATGEA